MARAALTALSFVAATTAASFAWAGTIQAISQGVITRTHTTHPGNLQPMWISLSDCEANDEFTFPLSLTYTSDETLQVWVSEGVDCTGTIARGINGSASCGLVYSTASPSSPTTTIKLSDRQLLSGLSHLGLNTATDPTCDVPANVGSGAQPLSIYFMLVTAGGNTVNSAQAVDFIKFAVIGPDPPTNVHSGVGEQMLKVSWDQSTNTNVGGYYVFCEAPPELMSHEVQQTANGGVGTVRQPQVDEAGSTLEDAAADGGAPGEPGETGAPAEDAGVSADAGGTQAVGAIDAGVSAADGGVADDANVTIAQAAATGDASLASGADAADLADATDQADGGATEDASASCPASSKIVSEYTQETAVSGGVPNTAFVQMYKCGQASGVTSSGVSLQGLQDGRSYTVAVAAYDVIGNVGKLSPPVCDGTTPTPVYGFFEAYRDSGGTAGGPKFCGIRNLGAASSKVGVSTLFGLLVALGIAVARRRARR